jgi:integrase
VDELQRQLAKGSDVARIIPYLFPHLTGKRAGTSRTAFYKAWRTACRRAGVPGMLTHDFRRTAVRNMERTGIPRSVATKLTGHRTEAVYRRYAIVSDADLRAASLRLSAHGTMGVDAVL